MSCDEMPDAFAKEVPNVFRTKQGMTISGNIEMQKYLGKCKACKKKHRCNRSMRRKCNIWNGR